MAKTPGLGQRSGMTLRINPSRGRVALARYALSATTALDGVVLGRVRPGWVEPEIAAACCLVFEPTKAEEAPEPMIAARGHQSAERSR
jgi:hypothetical protein